MRTKGLEPSRLAALEPKSSASTNSATSADKFKYSRELGKNSLSLTNFVKMLDKRSSVAGWSFLVSVSMFKQGGASLVFGACHFAVVPEKGEP